MIYGTVEFRHGLYKYGTGKLHTRRSAGWAGLEGIDGKYGVYIAGVYFRKFRKKLILTKVTVMVTAKVIYLIN